MTNPSRLSDPEVNREEELRRIYISALLACVLFVLSVILDGPVSVLSWILLVAGFLCLAYVVFASRYLLIHSRSHDHKVEPHE
jgi:Ca2+/Na+ antiporter